MPRLLPLFPLKLVVFPGAVVLLHIFEERYREMVGEAEAGGTEFGIVRHIERGEDTGLANSGCTVTVESVITRYPDGRFDVVTRGRRRFQILSLDEEKSYLRGEVEYFGDEPSGPVPSELLESARDAYRRLRPAMEAAGTPAPADPARPDLSFHFAEDIADLDFRSQMLQSRSEQERLRLFTQFAARYIPRREYTARMQKKAFTNGSGHHVPGEPPASR